MRTVPAAPSSFVRFAARACFEVTGTSLSIPTSDHVPLEIYASVSRSQITSVGSQKLIIPSKAP